MLARYGVARYTLCHGPVFVCPSVWLGTEGPRDAKQGWVFAMAKTIFAGTVEKTGKNRGEN